MTNQDILIVHPASEEQVAVVRAFLEARKIKFEYTNEENYNSEFVAKIKKARQDYNNGKGKIFTTEQLNSLWKQFSYLMQKLICSYGYQVGIRLS